MPWLLRFFFKGTLDLNVETGAGGVAIEHLDGLARIFGQVLADQRELRD